MKIQEDNLRGEIIESIDKTFASLQQTTRFNGNT